MHCFHSIMMRNLYVLKMWNNWGGLEVRARSFGGTLLVEQNLWQE
jgi:hypothetical protein